MSIRPRDAASRRPLVHVLLATSSVLALGVQAARGDDIVQCSTSSNQTCELTTGDTGANFNSTVTDNGFTASVQNSSTLTATAGSQPIMVLFHATGSDGDSDGDDGDGLARGIDGGEITVSNSGSMTLAGGGSGGSGRLSVIDVQGFGGDGAQPDSNGNDGGRGGDGGELTVFNRGVIAVQSDAPGANQNEIFGISLSSRGGDGGDMNGGAGDQKGGNGGDAKQVSVTNYDSGTIRLGGSEDDLLAAPNGARAITIYAAGGDGGSENGAGGAGGTINAFNDGAIEMFLDVSDPAEDPQRSVAGIYAHSQGGVGQPSQDNSDPGGKGEPGRPIHLQNSGSILIYAPSLTADYGAQEGSAAMFALSQGGDGGASPDKNVGGAGGGAAVDTSGAQQTIFLENDTGTIETHGHGISGMIGLARGGDGGDGNDGSGSRGGAGGRGGDVDVVMGANTSLITHGDEAYGIAGQSVGGIGGGGVASAGAGGAGGQLSLAAGAGSSIETRGDFAGAVVLQSLGGGGGVGEDFTGILFGSGGDGGNAGDASTVTITSQGTVATTGDHAFGLLAQSIGGGGGAGGVGAGLVLGLGGDGGEGGLGKQATVHHSGSVSTSGYGANGIAAQSISGGGGAAGVAGGVLSIGGQGGASGADSGSISGKAGVNTAGDVTTTGDASIGVLAQSIGGGGGAGAGALGIAAVGGSGGAASGGGQATIFAVAGTTQTSGDFSHGLVAQSISGGGGTGGDVIDLSVGVGLGVGGAGGSTVTSDRACISTDYDGCDVIGASPNNPDGAPSDEGVTRVITRGDFSTGVMAQSIGGGGGSGGTATGGGVLDLATVQLGGTGTAGGNGYTAQVYWHGAYIDTYGQNSPGMVVQSIGGGGGAGGSSLAVGAEDVVALQIGGGGGAGGSGRDAEADVHGGQIRTRGANSAAVVVQTIGGGGGTGGSASGLVADVGFGFSVSVGGGGGAGGGAGSDNDGAVARITEGATLVTGLNDDGTADFGAADSVGLLVQAIGGGGGLGGASVADALTVAVPVDPEDPAAAVSLSVSTAVGGVGGSGGPGGLAFVDLDDATIATGGDGSHGALVQSIGGGGGAGGTSQAMSASIGYGESASLDLAASVGGSGGSGGRGGPVQITLENGTAIQTFGANANGLLAQSIGGGGGDGGVGSAANGTKGGGFAANVDIGVGGTGGTGGVGGEVQLTAASGTTISTAGPGSRAIVAQSVGGGGGTSQGGTIGVGLSFSTAGGEEGEGESEGGEYSGQVSVGIGASGGSGATGALATLDISSAIATAGDDADGIVTQSIGGGGGLGGSAANDPGGEDDGEGVDDETTSYDLALEVGGRGGSGGVGGRAQLTFGGSVLTRGDWAEAAVVQSIGGGGGAGGTATAEGSQATANLTLGVGGTGGTGGNGGTAVFYGNAGGASLSTQGYGAHALVVQSIGGGGGLGADGSDKAAGTLTVGGADGGSGGAAGDGGTLIFDDQNHPLVFATQGDDAYGVLLQSIGGGGGLGGAGNSEASEDDDSHQLQVTVGGRGGASGDGASYSISLKQSTITTSGDRAFGLVAQSIGGGGGVGGASDTGSLASVTVGGAGGASGHGGAVSVDFNVGAQVATSGDGAHGVILQSIGGGGGIGGDASGPTFQFRGIAGREAADGEGGDVSFTMEGGSIRTTGTRAHGLIAQSISGGGGIEGGPQGVSYGSQAGDAPTAATTGDVTLDIRGTIQASGANAIGVLAQADGARTPGEISVEVSGSVVGGTGSGSTGVLVIEGSDSTVRIDAGGLVGTTDGDGYAVRYLASRTRAEGAYLTVDNAGTMIGDISFANGDGEGDVAGTLNNTGTWSGIDRSAADVTNAGTVDLVVEPGVFSGGGAAPGDGPRLSVAVPEAPSRRDIAPARLNGDFTQTSEGTLRVTGDFDRRRMDLLRVDGTARLGGTLLIEPVSISPGAQLQVIAADGGLRGRFDEVTGVLFDFAQRRRGGELAIEAVDSDFADPSLGLDAQQARAGRYLDQVFDAGGDGFGEFFAGQERLARLDAGAYARSLSIFAPGATLAPAAANFDRARSRLDAARSCDAPGAGGGGLGEGETMLGETVCLRMLGALERRDQDGDASGAFGYDGSVWTTGVAGQAAVAPGWVVGGAVGYEGADYSGDTGTSAEGGTGFLALAARHEVGAWGFGAAAGGSWGSFDVKRRLAGATASAETDVWSASGRLHADWTMPLPHGWFRPSLDLDVVHSAAGGYTERGAGALNLALSSSSETAVMLTPALEIGGETPLTPTSTLRSWVRVGATLSSLDGYGADGRLASANPGLGAFETVVAVPDATARLSAGLAVVTSERMSVEAVYDGAFADGYTSHGGGVRLTLRF